MIAKKCDRCVRLYEQYNVKNDEKQINGLLLLNIDSKQSYYSHKIKDLCPECSFELMEWLKNADL